MSSKTIKFKRLWLPADYPRVLSIFTTISFSFEKLTMSMSKLYEGFPAYSEI